ncbi:MAG TPA: TolC family protein [Blastocatellia bacterium]|nr:TolC family protein [Blastocatellia bacterium]
MKFKKAVASLLAGAIATTCAATNVVAQQRNHTPLIQNLSNNDAPAAGQVTLSLEDLERMALANNPTLAQAEAAIRAAEGRRKQAGLWPNPIVGYEGDGLAVNELVRDFRIGHYLWVEQSIVGFGKLGKSKRIAEQEKVQSISEAEAQRLRVLNAVRMLYYEALGAQTMVDLRNRLLDVTREAVGISEELFNVGQADRPDVLSTEIESQRAELDLMRAQNDLARVWRVMAAVVNDPELKESLQPARLAGSIEAEAPMLNLEDLLAQLLRESPEIKAAIAGVARAKAVTDRAKAEPRPDMFVKAWVGHSRDFAEFFGGVTGWETRVEAGVRIPLFNRNQGNVAAATSELVSAEKELQRVELALRARLAESYNSYMNSLAVAARYNREILPRAQKAYEMYLSKFRQMAAAYPQALIAQRTLFQSQTEYVTALVDLWQNVVQLRGMLLMGGLDAPPGAEIGKTGRSAISPMALSNDQ